MRIAENWKDYELIDMGEGEKLERWGEFIFIRPDPQIIWPTNKNKGLWKRCNAHYHRSKQGGGQWEFTNPLPEYLSVSYEDLKFFIRPTDFKHMGLFPEQAVNWRWIKDKIKKSGRDVRVLNLFAYTGGATLAAASAGASVCHVDAAKGMNRWAKENAELSGLTENKLRFITDDVLKFVQREKRRGNSYDAVIMDPPAYGRGPNGELWKLENSLFSLVSLCNELLSDNPLFFLINLYTTGLSPIAAENILKASCGNLRGGQTSSEEVGLLASQSGLVLPCGVYGRWEA